MIKLKSSGDISGTALLVPGTDIDKNIVPVSDGASGAYESKQACRNKEERTIISPLNRKKPFCFINSPHFNCFESMNQMP
jgi:hypothetical protein